MAEESDEALEISNTEECTILIGPKESMDQSTPKSLQSGSPTVIPCWMPRPTSPADLVIQKETSEY